MKHRFSIMFIAAALFAAPVIAQTDTTFTYQGSLNFEGEPYTGDADYRFILWDAPGGGEQVGADFHADGVEVEGGLFTAGIDFGQAAHGPDRYLQIEVRTPAWDGMGSEPAFFVFPERTALTPAPYALQTRGIFVSEEGRVGINTTEPADVIGNARLDVAGGHVVVDNNFGVLSENSSGTGIGAGFDTGTDDSLFLYAGGSTRATLSSNGFFGIDTASPQDRLHLGRGAIRFPDNSRQVTAYRPTIHRASLVSFFVPANGQLDITVPGIPGAEPGMSVIVNPPYRLWDLHAIGFAYVESPGRVVFRILSTGGGDRVYGAGTWRITILP